MIKGLVPGAEILRWAGDNHTAVGAFNFSNLETLQAVVEASKETNCPTILQVTESAINYLGLEYVVAMISVAVQGAQNRLALHLDHGSNFDVCKRCIDAGFSSVMIDNSLLEFKQNVANTTEVVEYAKKNGVSVEAELGALAGIEDNISVDLQESIYTNPDQAQKFVEDTKIDSLAVAIGTKHGPNKGAPNAPPKLDFERLTRIKMALGGRFPLVLHGASAVDSKLTELCNEHGGNIQNAIGIKDEDVLEAIRRGINKVNIDTDLRLAFLAGLRQSLAKFPDKLDIRKHMGAAREEMNVYAVRKIKLITTPGLG